MTVNNSIKGDLNNPIFSVIDNVTASTDSCIGTTTPAASEDGRDLKGLSPKEPKPDEIAQVTSKARDLSWVDLRRKCEDLVATEDDHIRQGGPHWESTLLGRHRDRQSLSEIRSKQQLHELEIDTRGECLARVDREVRLKRGLASDSWSRFKSDRAFSSSIARGATQWGENDNPFQMNLDDELSRIEKALQGISTNRRTEDIMEEPDDDDSKKYEMENSLMSKLRSKHCFLNSMTTWGDTGTGRSLDWHDV
ncbi:uncharacterized protein L199_002050 [Kwoniella botswanensis]|uniref:uncharacterized protein n=1 Tax=Kwoniella botswanensis TaxID=1268659 RepID=UPI00315CFEF0